jgi:hypothetical protein
MGVRVVEKVNRNGQRPFFSDQSRWSRVVFQVEFLSVMGIPAAFYAESVSTHGTRIIMHKNRVKNSVRKYLIPGPIIYIIRLHEKFWFGYRPQASLEQGDRA